MSDQTSRGPAFPWVPSVHSEVTRSTPSLCPLPHPGSHLPRVPCPQGSSFPMETYTGSVASHTCSSPTCLAGWCAGSVWQNKRLLAPQPQSLSFVLWKALKLGA